MKAEIEYKSKVFEECPSNYDLTKITDEKEVKFIKWIDILQGTTTVLTYEIKIFNYYCGLYFLNDTLKAHYNVFFCSLLSNLSLSIAINFDKLVNPEAEMSIQKLRTFCEEVKYLFKTMDYNTCFKNVRNSIKSVSKKYEKHYQTARNQVLAHTDLIMLNEKEVVKIMKQPINEIADSMLKEVQEIIDTIWSSYSGHNLCYSLVGDDDYKNIAKILCEKYGNM